MDAGSWTYCACKLWMFILIQIYSTPHKKTSVKSLLSARKISGASDRPHTWTYVPVRVHSTSHHPDVTLPGRARANDRWTTPHLGYGLENKLHFSLLKARWSSATGSKIKPSVMAHRKRTGALICLIYLLNTALHTVMGSILPESKCTHLQ